MNNQNHPRRGFATRVVYRYICVFLLGGILYAGLTPFRAPHNEAAWVPNTNAMRFGEHGTSFTTEPLASPDPGEGRRSIEMWAQPGKPSDSATVISFYSPASTRHVSLRQDESDLVVYLASSSAWRWEKAERLYIPEAFRDRGRSFWAVTFGRSGTAVYRDAVLVAKSGTLHPSRGALSGRLVIANSPIFNESWSGVLSGLAIYNSELTATQIARHYAHWNRGPTHGIMPDDRCIGLYPFDERTGPVIHNRALAGTDIYIPARYTVLRQTFLDPVWRAYSESGGLVQDALVNIVGFIPLGFFLSAYFVAGGCSRPMLRAIAVAAASSLLIEVIQTFLPTRDSSMADLIDNIIGSFLGAVLCRGSIARTVDHLVVLVGHGRPHAHS